MQQKGLMEKNDTLTYYPEALYAIPSPDAPASYYVFNYGPHGFIIASADDRCLPILGYSMNGSFDNNRLPDNMRHWLKAYSDEIQQGIQANAPQNPEHLAIWKQLLNGHDSDNPQPKSDEYLLTSTWEQGNGYNNYCPVLNGQHVVVGCVATAMAQIIRYYGYPLRGFGQKSYHHETYGVQAVDFDTTDYDYSLMPDRIRRSSSAEQRDMVSRLCYHCGVVVNMNYQNANHTTGSGTQTSKVPEGLLYFGYTDAMHLTRNGLYSDTEWRRIIVNEIDNRRPIEYSGFSTEGGHAFVLDGYNNSNQYHFNWGWGGYSDGFYSLTTMVGFTSQHEMVINIYPSGWDGHLTTFLVSPEGDGDGTSWDQSNSNLEAAVKLNKLVEREIWMKEGTYHGTSGADYAYTLSTAAKILGGFAGTETSVAQRRPNQHLTIIDGEGIRGLLSLNISSNSRRTAMLDNIILQNGHTTTSDCISIFGQILAQHLTIHHCQSDSGSIISLNSSESVSIGTRIEDNTAPVICMLNEGVIRQSLINNNQGNAVSLNYSARVVNCDIVANQGTGVTFNHKHNSFVNNIVWGNDTCLRFTAVTNDTSIRHSAFDSDTAVGDSTCLLLSHDNTDGPRFINPSATRGVQTGHDDSDWHLGRGSACIDAGQRLPECLTDGDLDQKLRCRNGHIDLGCYESNYPVSITQADDEVFSIYPNPATSFITITLPNAAVVDIHDMSGRCLLSQPASAGSTRLDISSLPQGMYIISTDSHSTKLNKQ